MVGTNDSLGTAIVEIRADLKRLRADLVKAQGITRQSMKRLAVSAKAAGRALSLALTAPIIAAGFAFVRSAVKFETSLSRIQGLVGLSAEAVRGFERDIIALGPAVGKGPNELAEAMFFITSAGLRGAKALEALEASAKAASAGLGSVVAVADAVTSAVNAFQGQMLSAADAAGILVATVREGKAAADSIGAAIGRVTGIAAALGATFNDIGAIIALLTRTGSTAEEASTTIGAFFNTLIQGAKEGSDQADALAKVGLSFEQLRDVIKGPNGTLGVLQLLAKAFKGNEIALGKVFPNVRALRGLLQLVGDRAAETEEVFLSLANATEVDLNDAFAVAALTAEFKFNAQMAEMQILMNKIGKDVLPLVLDVVKALGKVLRDASRGWSELTEEEKATIIKTVAMTAVMGPLLLVIGALIGAVSSLAGAFVALRVAMRAHPILFIASILLTVAGAVVALDKKTDFITKTYETYRDVLDEVNERLEKIKKLTGELRAEEEKLTQAVIDETRAEVLRERTRLRMLLADAIARAKAETTRRSGTDFISAGAMAQIDNLKQRIAGLAQVLNELELAELAIEWENLWAGMRGAVELTAKKTASVIDAVLKRIADKGQGADSFIVKLSDAFEKLNSQFSLAATKTKAFNNKLAEGQAIIDATRTATEKFNIEMAEATALMKEGFIDEETFERWKELLEDIRDASTDVLTDMQRVIRAVILTVGRMVGDSIFDMVTGAKSILEGLKDLAKSISEFILRTLIQALIVKGLTAAFPELFPTGSEKGNVFGGGGGHVKAFQKGGIIGGPTLFPLGLAGEKGPEAILPLKRGPGGRLGVENQGGGAFVQTNTFNFMSDVKASVREEVLNLAPLLIAASEQAAVNRSRNKR